MCRVQGSYRSFLLANLIRDRSIRDLRELPAEPVTIQKRKVRLPLIRVHLEDRVVLLVAVHEISPQRANRDVRLVADETEPNEQNSERPQRETSHERGQHGLVVLTHPGTPVLL